MNLETGGKKFPLVQLSGAIQLQPWNHNIYFVRPCLCLVRGTASHSTGTGSVPSSTTDFLHLSGKKSLSSTSEKMLHTQLQTFDLTPGLALSSTGHCKHCWPRLGHLWNPDLMDAMGMEGTSASSLHYTDFTLRYLFNGAVYKSNQLNQRTVALCSAHMPEIKSSHSLAPRRQRPKASDCAWKQET